MGQEHINGTLVIIYLESIGWSFCVDLHTMFVAVCHLTLPFCQCLFSTGYTFQLPNKSYWILPSDIMHSQLNVGICWQIKIIDVLKKEIAIWTG